MRPLLYRQAQHDRNKGNFIHLFRYTHGIVEIIFDLMVTKLRYFFRSKYRKCCNNKSNLRNLLQLYIIELDQ